MSWLSGGELHSGAWTSSSYAGLGILFDNLPTTGENGGSPLLNDGGVNGDEVRWELLTASGVTLTEFNENGSFASSGIGSFTYRSYINNVAVVPDFTVTINSASGTAYAITCDTVTDSHTANSVTLTYTTPAGTAYSITCDAVTDAHTVGAVVFYRGYSLTADAVTDAHFAGEVNFRLGPFNYSITCETVTDAHSAENVILRYLPPSDPIDYGMSGFGNNPYWRNSIFFRGR